MPWTFTCSRHWEVFLEINLIQKTSKFCTSWVHWKNQCRSSVRKHALLWNKHEYQHFADTFLKIIFNSLSSTGLFLYFLKYIRKPEVSLSFQGALKESGAIKWVKSHFIFSYFLQNEIVNFPHLILMTKTSPITLTNCFSSFNTSSGFFFQFEACTIYCFDA